MMKGFLRRYVILASLLTIISGFLTRDESFGIRLATAVLGLVIALAVTIFFYRHVLFHRQDEA